MREKVYAATRDEMDWAALVIVLRHARGLTSPGRPGKIRERVSRLNDGRLENERQVIKYLMTNYRLDAREKHVLMMTSYQMIEEQSHRRTQRRAQGIV